MSDHTNLEATPVTYPPISGLRPPGPRVARSVAMALLQFQNDALRQRNTHLEELVRTSLVDADSGIHNRLYFDQRLTQEFSRARRFGLQLSLLIVRLDAPVEDNQPLSDATVDALVRWVARVAVVCSREFDVVCRLERNEVAILLPSTTDEGAEIFARRFARKLSTANIESSCPPGVSFRSTFGWANAPEQAETEVELILSAEESLYRERKGLSKRSAEIAA